MSIFSRALTPQKVAHEILGKALAVSKILPNSVRRITPQGYDPDVVLFEMFILVFTAFRLGIQNSGLSHNTLSEIFDNYDITAKEIFRFNSDEFDEILHRRGLQYLRLLKTTHYLESKESDTFGMGLALLFDQFCLGGGEDDAPPVIGDPLKMFPLGVYAGQFWSECYLKTLVYVMKSKLK